MFGIHDRELLVQQAWKNAAAANGDAEEFCVDGLLFRGPIYYENGFWRRKQGDEEQQWNDSNRRLLILTREMVDESAWDIREETGRKNAALFSYDRASAFYKGLRMWSYGLLNATKDGYPPFRDASNMEIAGPFYETAPIARINCKKQVSNQPVSKVELMNYLQFYADKIIEQISIYDATIILCCDSSSGTNLIFDFVRSQYLTDLVNISGKDNIVFFSPSTKKIVLKSYHPSARIGYEYSYEDLMEAFSTSLETLEVEL